MVETQIEKSIEYLWRARDLINDIENEEKRALVVGYTKLAYDLLFEVQDELSGKD